VRHLLQPGNLRGQGGVSIYCRLQNYMYRACNINLSLRRLSQPGRLRGQGDVYIYCRLGNDL
jgi:hypothetical protein